MGWTTFQERFKKINDRWYGVRNEDGFHVWEKPLIRKPGFEDDYCILKLSFEQMEKPGNHFGTALEVLKRIDKSRKQGRQLDQIKAMRRSNDMKEAERKKIFDREIEQQAKYMRPLIKKLADESGYSRIQGMRNDTPSETKKKLHDKFEGD